MQTGQQSGKAPIRAGMAFLGAALFGSALFATPAWAATYLGEPVKVGDGTAQVVVETGTAGTPSSISIRMTAGALDGLPTALSKTSAEGSWEYALPMPLGPAETGYRHVVIDWNPQGHPPQHVYTVPHFDFHFYFVDPEVVDQIKFTGPADPATKVSDKGLVPADYQVIPESAINRMGVHALDMAAPEFKGKPFTATFVYGYYSGRLIFVEPMVTRAFLRTNPDMTMPVRTPAHYSGRGYFPTKYSVRYDAAKNCYIVELGGLTLWEQTTSASH